MSDIPRKKIDIIYHEILGDVSNIVQRIEQINTAQAEIASAQLATMEAVQEVASTLENLPNDISQRISDTMSKEGLKLNVALLDSFNARLSETRVEINEVAIASQRYALLAHKSARKIIFLSVVTGGFAGFIAASLLLLI